MMAQRIQTVCDVHAERGEDVDAETWEVLARKAGTRTQVREVDLCEECSSALAAVAAFAAENGRTVPQSRAKALSAVAARQSMPPSSTSSPSASGERPMASCPVEGCGSVVQGNNLARHVRQLHGLTPEAAGLGAPADAVHQCPDCDRTFTRAQGLGAHRYQAHGYESPTRAGRLERAERLGPERAAS